MNTSHSSGGGSCAPADGVGGPEHRVRRRLRAVVGLAAALVIGAGGMLAGCKDVPPVPASSDPQGKDLVEGAVVAAAEAGGGYRILKVVHLDDYPDPIGYELHLMAFDPKVQTYEEAARLWALDRGKTKVAFEHMMVTLAAFMKRDHRVLLVEPVTKEEMAPYVKARDARQH